MNLCTCSPLQVITQLRTITQALSPVRWRVAVTAPLPGLQGRRKPAGHSVVVTYLRRCNTVHFVRPTEVGSAMEGNSVHKSVQAERPRLGVISVLNSVLRAPQSMCPNNRFLVSNMTPQSKRLEIPHLRTETVSKTLCSLE